MSRIMGVAEILKQISSIKSKEERQNALASCYNNQALMQMLHACFHPDVKFLLPAGDPPFKKLEKSVDAQGSLYRESRKMHYFIEGLSPDLHPLKRETMFVQLLEALDPDDADLMLAVKDKKMPYKGITYDLVASTFPGLLPEQTVEQKTEEKKSVGKKVPCPFGCESSSEDGLFSPGPLVMHMRKAHPEEAGSSENGEEID